MHFGRPERSGARCYDPENDVNFDLTIATLKLEKATPGA